METPFDLKGVLQSAEFTDGLLAKLDPRVPRPSPATSSVDLIILVDQSGSMASHARVARQAAEEAIEQARESCGHGEVRVKWLVVDTIDGGVGPVSSSYKGFESHQAHLLSIGATGPFAQDDSGHPGQRGEEGADAITDLARHNDWIEGSCRSVLYLSDTWPDGDSSPTTDQKSAVDQAIASCKNAEVTVFAHYISRSSPNGSIASLYNKLCGETGGRAEIGGTSSTDLYVPLIAKAICGACGAKQLDKPSSSACCPPWHSGHLSKLFVIPQSGVDSPYKIRFAPATNPKQGSPFQGFTKWYVSQWAQNPVFKQMQAYVDYVATVTSLTKLTVHFAIIDLGPLGGGGGQGKIEDRWLTWIAGNPLGPVPVNWPFNGNFFNAPLQINRRYRLHTGVYIEGGEFFDVNECNGHHAEFHKGWAMSQRRPLVSTDFAALAVADSSIRIGKFARAVEAAAADLGGHPRIPHELKWDTVESHPGPGSDDGTSRVNARE